MIWLPYYVCSWCITTVLTLVGQMVSIFITACCLCPIIFVARIFLDLCVFTTFLLWLWIDTLVIFGYFCDSSTTYLSLLTESLNVAVFTVYSVLMNVSDLFTHMHPFIPTWSCLMIPNTCITSEWLFVHVYQFQAKTGNNVSEFMHSNWIMPSYYSSPKHKESAS